MILSLMGTRPDFPELDSDERRILLAVVEESLLAKRLAHGYPRDHPGATEYATRGLEIRTLEKVREALR